MVADIQTQGTSTSIEEWWAPWMRCGITGCGGPRLRPGDPTTGIVVDGKEIAEETASEMLGRLRSTL